MSVQKVSRVWVLMGSRGVDGYGSIRKPANSIKPNLLFTKICSSVGRVRFNLSNPHVIGLSIEFEFLNPFTCELNPTFNACLRGVVLQYYTLCFC
jgi:hypothetical protein